jgi:hypothetical protein
MGPPIRAEKAGDALTIFREYPICGDDYQPVRFLRDSHKNISFL